MVQCLKYWNVACIQLCDSPSSLTLCLCVWFDFWLAVNAFLLKLHPNPLSFSTMSECFYAWYWVSSTASGFSLCPHFIFFPTLHTVSSLSGGIVLNLTLFLGSPDSVGVALCCRAPSCSKRWFTHGCGPALTPRAGPGSIRWGPVDNRCHMMAWEHQSLEL